MSSYAEARAEFAATRAPEVALALVRASVPELHRLSVEQLRAVVDAIEFAKSAGWVLATVDGSRTDGLELIEAVRANPRARELDPDLAELTRCGNAPKSRVHATTCSRALPKIQACTTN